jgi:RIO kinase 1
VHDDPFDPFLEEGLITGVIRPVRSGKEASVYLCSAGPSTGRRFLAVKAYRGRQHRNFRNQAVYKEGRAFGGKAHREQRALERHTRFGQELDDAMWVGREASALRTMAEAGADVPRVWATSEEAIVLDYLGDEEGPAPQLVHAELPRDEARAVFDRLLWNVERFLLRDLVHADLSAFNVLWWEGRASIIDLPQAVDARTNPHAPDLLVRDVTNLVKHFGRYGVRADPDALAQDLWVRYQFAML